MVHIHQLAHVIEHLHGLTHATAVSWWSRVTLRFQTSDKHSHRRACRHAAFQDVFQAFQSRGLHTNESSWQWTRPTYQTSVGQHDPNLIYIYKNNNYS